MASRVRPTAGWSASYVEPVRVPGSEGDGSSDAEVAFVVADAWQGRGLGSVLFRRLAARAAELGVRRLVAETLFSNRRMLAVFRHAVLPCVETIQGDVVRVVLDLSPASVPVAEDPAPEPSTASPPA